MSEKLYCDTCERFITKKDIRLLAEKNKVVHKNHKLIWIGGWIRIDPDSEKAHLRRKEQ